MLQITSHNLKSTPLKNSVNFGLRQERTESSQNGKSPEEIKAAQLEKIAQAAAESTKLPSTARSFTIIALLMSASALTASALAGRFFNLLNGIGALKKIAPKAAKGLEALDIRLNFVEASKLKGIKGSLIKGAQKTVTYLENASKYGIEEQLARLNAKKARKIKAIQNSIVKANPDVTYTKEELSKAAKEAIKNSEAYQNYFKKIENQVYDLKGSNLTKKATRATAATVMGGGALKEASRDEDKNGVPDVVEYNHAKKEATQKVTAAIIDVALDSLG